MTSRDLGWFETSVEGRPWAEAEAMLVRSRTLRPAVLAIGPCTLRPRKDYFRVLTLSLFNQQLATKTAATLHRRFTGLFPQRRPTPQRVLEVLDGRIDDATLRWCGLSRQKRTYLRDLAEHFADGRVPTRRLARMSDAEIIGVLTGVKGVGLWTAQMFLLFALNRPDVWPGGDLGLRDAVRASRKLSERPEIRGMDEYGARYRPWRSIATWYLWRGQSAGVWDRSPKSAAGNG